jgi:hypothetical protein
MYRLALLALAASCESPIKECTDLRINVPVTCADRPELCGLPVRSVIHEPALSRAIDIVFVPEGYDDMIAFRDHVMSLIDALEHDDNGIVAIDPALFNYHWIALDGVNLGGCYSDDTSNGPGPWVEADEAAAELAARANAPDVDVVVTIVNLPFGRAHAELRSALAITRPTAIVLGDADDERTLTHELGHALFSLADEYVDLDGCAPDFALANATATDDLPAIANASYDPAGTKWADLVHGARPGGARYACGLYHPTDDCRMRDQYAGAFCPVCLHAIRTELARRRAGGDDGPPTCILGTRSGGVWVEVFDRDAPVHLTLREDDFETVSGPYDTQRVTFGTSCSPGAHVFDAECTDVHGASSRAALAISCP